MAPTVHSNLGGYNFTTGKSLRKSLEASLGTIISASLLAVLHKFFPRLASNLLPAQLAAAFTVDYWYGRKAKVFGYSKDSSLSTMLRVHPRCGLKIYSSWRLDTMRRGVCSERATQRLRKEKNTYTQELVWREGALLKYLITWGRKMNYLNTPWSPRGRESKNILSCFHTSVNSHTLHPAATHPKSMFNSSVDVFIYYFDN